MTSACAIETLAIALYSDNARAKGGDWSAWVSLTAEQRDVWRGFAADLQAEAALTGERRDTEAGKAAA